jgi:hypothetical protein
MSYQAFKTNDLVEAKVKSCFDTILDLLASYADDFYEGAYEAFPFGDVLFETGHPLNGVITQDVFREIFPEIHDIFTRPGTFDFYCELFQAIWGEDVSITFTVPAPGKLVIDIEALETEENFALARKIVDNEYVYNEIIDHDGDNIIFQGTRGIKTQRELDALIREISPNGVWVEATLTLL